MNEKLPPEWKRHKDFNLNTEIAKLSAYPIIEVGGPTESGFPLVSWEDVTNATFTSNITPGSPTYSQDGELSHYYGKVDFQADAKKLPLKEKSVGMLISDSLPPEILDNYIDEANRVLVDQGILLIQGLNEDDVLFITKNNFELMQYKFKDGSIYYAVFRKKQATNE